MFDMLDAAQERTLQLRNNWLDHVMIIVPRDGGIVG